MKQNTSLISRKQFSTLTYCSAIICANIPRAFSEHLSSVCTRGRISFAYPKLASVSVSLNHCDQRVHKWAMETLYDSRLSPWDLGWNFQIQPASSCPNQILGSWKMPTRQRSLPTVSRSLIPASYYSVRNGRSAPQQRDHTRNRAIWIRGSSSPTGTTVRHTRTQ